MHGERPCLKRTRMNTITLGDVMKKAVKIIAWIAVYPGQRHLLIYTYALLAPLSLSEQRQHITLYDRSGDILYESNFGEGHDVVRPGRHPHPSPRTPLSPWKTAVFTCIWGFDPIRIASALRNNLRSDTLQGGSTITQQYAKNLFLTNEQTLQRKIEEFFYAVRLEMHYSKGRYPGRLSQHLIFWSWGLWHQRSFLLLFRQNDG